MSEDEQLVRYVVYLQRTSPNFASYCISHVTDARHSFLYSDANSYTRRRYLHLLRDAEESARQRGATGDDVAQSTLSTTKHWNPTTVSRDLTPAQTSSLPYDVLSTDFRQDVARRVVTAHNVRVIWRGLRLRLLAQRGSRRDGAGTRHETVQSRRSCGPHAPHRFHDKTELQRFLFTLLRAAAYKSREGVTAVVHYMLHRLPMTGAFLHVLVYVMQELLSLYLDDVLASHDALSEKDSCVPLPGEAMGEAAEQEKGLIYVEAAGTVFFALTMLFAEHRARETQMHDEGAADVTVSGNENNVLYYQDAFEYWILEVTHVVAETLNKYPPLRSTVLFDYMAETVDVWRREHCLSDGVLDHISRLLAMQA